MMFSSLILRSLALVTSLTPTKRPELADFAQHIALWRDRYEPPEDLRDDNLGMHPYLGSAHEYQEKIPALPLI
jgi:hypothetical protein